MNVAAVLLPWVVLLLGSAQTLAAENWPQWRGPQYDGIAAEGKYPQQLSAEENLLWKVALPGRGCSTPAVWEEQIFVTCAINGHDGVVCYDFDGNQLWQQQFGIERPGKHRNGSGSNPSPVTDGRHLVVYYKSGTVACLDLAGNIDWQTNLQDKYGPDELWWDLGTSPVIVDGKAVIAVCNAGQGYLVALDLSSGEEIWKTDRTYETPEESDQAYTTPCVMTRDGRQVIVTAGADHVTGHDARTGELLWECGGMNPGDEGMQRMIASPAPADDAVIVPYARGGKLLKVRLGGRGDVTDTHTLWNEILEVGDVPTPLVIRDQVLILSDTGHISLLDLATSAPIWLADLPKSRHKYYASPVLAGNTLYFAREDGMLYSCNLGEEGLSVVAENEFGEQLLATPVPIGGKLLVRGTEHLFLFR